MCTNGTCVFLLVDVLVLPNKQHQKDQKFTEPKQISQQFEGQNMVGYDLYRLSISQAPCLEGVFRHQITSLLFYRDGFIVNGCRFTCQTMPPFTILNLLAFTSPTWLHRFRFKLSTKQKFLDYLDYGLHYNGFHTPTEVIFD